MSELRFDPVRKQWVLISPERGNNPQFYYINDKKFALDQKDCPFCSGNEKMAGTELFRIADPNEPSKWSLRVVPNNVPLLKVEETLKRSGHGMYDQVSGMGAHEVIIDTPLHSLTLEQYSEDILFNVFTAIKSRITDLCNDTRIRYIHVFKNHGYGAGAFMEHPHTQILGLPVFTKFLKQELSSAKEYYLSKERCLFCDIMAEETHYDQRIVAENMDFIAFVPYAALAAFEVQILPKRHNHDMTAISFNEMKSFAAILHTVLKQYYVILGNPPFNFSLYTTPPTNKRPEYPNYWQSIQYDYHWRLSVIPRITRAGGIALGSGLMVNPVPPEKSALLLRQVKI